MKKSMFSLVLTISMGIALSAFAVFLIVQNRALGKALRFAS
jgi:hypothetical protein